MEFVLSLYVAVLFFVLVPGVLLSLPKGGSKYTVAVVHALVFGLVFHVTHKLVKRAAYRLEGFEEMKPTKKAM
jgi:hypothetical protein